MSDRQGCLKQRSWSVPECWPGGAGFNQTCRDHRPGSIHKLVPRLLCKTRTKQTDARLLRTTAARAVLCPNANAPGGLTVIGFSDAGHDVNALAIRQILDRRVVISDIIGADFCWYAELLHAQTDGRTDGVRNSSGSGMPHVSIALHRHDHLFDEDFQELRGNGVKVPIDFDWVQTIEPLWKRHISLRRQRGRGDSARDMEGCGRRGPGFSP